MKINEEEHSKWEKAQKKLSGAERAGGSGAKSAGNVIAGTAATEPPRPVVSLDAPKKQKKTPAVKNPSGRRPDLPRLNKQILVKCADEEHALIFQAAAALGLTPNRFLVAAALKATSELLKSRDLVAEVMMEQMIAKCLRLGREQPCNQPRSGVV